MDENFLSRLSKAVSGLRGDLSYRDMGKKYGMGASAIRQWELRENSPNLPNLERLAQARGQLPEEFLAHLYGRSIAQSSNAMGLLDRIRELPKPEVKTLTHAMIDFLTSSE
jgi:transcriptional regulator with XRE-family HTH domain